MKKTKFLIFSIILIMIIPNQAQAAIPFLVWGTVAAGTSLWNALNPIEIKGYLPSSHYQVFSNDVNLLAVLSDPINKAIVSTQSLIFNTAQSFLNGQGGIFYWVVGISILIWSVNRMKHGYPTREEMFKAGTWIVWVLFIIGIFSSQEAYKIFISWFNIPSAWVYDTIASAMNMPADTITKNLTYYVNKTLEIPIRLYDEAFQYETIQNKSILGKLGFTNGIENIWSAIKIIIWTTPVWLTSLIVLFALIGVVAITIVSGIICALFICVAPLTIPLLMLDKTKPYFYSWLKAYISYTLYIPLALFVLLILNNQYALFFSATNLVAGNNESALLTWYKYDTQIQHCYQVAIISIFGIFLLKKIPTWVSQVMGTQGLESGGVGAGAATAGMAMGAATTMGAGAIANKMAGGSLTGGALKALGSKMPGAETFKSLMNASKNKSSQNQMNNINDKLDKALEVKGGAVTAG